MHSEDSQVRGLVLNIQRYSVHDGTGIRTTVFLKGCPLRCRWCSNPESQRPFAELGFNPGKCILTEGCDMCAAACPTGARFIDAEGRIRVDTELCTICFSCAGACPTGALIVYGYVRSVGEVLAAVEKDGLFYARSGGGMTMSGGEPMSQPDFTNALLREARRRRIDTSMETCGHCSWVNLREACRNLNALIYDIKLMDPEKHKRFTNVSNERILENLAMVRKNFPDLPILARTPVIPGVNDNKEEITAIVDFLRTIPEVRYELLPYHRLGSPKYGYLCREYELGDAALNDQRLRELKEIAAGL